MTRSTLRTEVRKLLKEETAAFWSDATLNTFLNDALRTYASKTGMSRKVFTASSVLNQEDYRLPGSLVLRTPLLDQTPPLHYVLYNGKPLEWVSPAFFQLAKGYGAGATLGTTPIYYTVFAVEELSDGLTWALRLLPVPPSAITDGITIGAERKAPTLSLDTDVPGIPEEDHLILADEAAALAFLQRNQTEEAATYRALFERTILERIGGLLPQEAPRG